jgi:hypothetical protein
VEVKGYQVKVFCDEKDSGCSVIVWLPEVVLSDTQMWMLAREMKSPENIFIMPNFQNNYVVAKCFIPYALVNHCLDAIFGAAHILLERILKNRTDLTINVNGYSFSLKKDGSSITLLNPPVYNNVAKVPDVIFKDLEPSSYTVYKAYLYNILNTDPFILMHHLEVYNHPQELAAIYVLEVENPKIIEDFHIDFDNQSGYTTLGFLAITKPSFGDIFRYRYISRSDMSSGQIISTALQTIIPFWFQEKRILTKQIFCLNIDDERTRIQYNFEGGILEVVGKCKTTAIFDFTMD